jgi:SAM-dependent methyltransferase
MSNPYIRGVFTSGAAYEPYVGRWSRLVAEPFLDWLSAGSGGDWLDVGSGTGVLSQILLQKVGPRRVMGLDRSFGFTSFAHAHVHASDGRAAFAVADATALPVPSSTFDAVVSGLVLNFIPRPVQALTEMARATRPGGLIGVYVWDYAGRMEFMRFFWDAAVELDAGAATLDEGRRFSICRPEVLQSLFESAGLQAVSVKGIEIATHFRDFDDYWLPFLGGQGPAPNYLMQLGEPQRLALREIIRARLPFAPDGSIPLVARAWAVRGVR